MNDSRDRDVGINPAPALRAVSQPARQMSWEHRRLPVGAEPQPDGSTHFRVWAPRPRRVTLVLDDPARGEREIPLQREARGYFAAVVPDVGSGSRYRYRLDGRLFADPASRFQPDGPSGPSEVVDPALYLWRDGSWGGITLHGQVLYELHVGTFTREGTWRTAMEHLAHVKSSGITTVEVMPVSAFPGRFGWGYDGVLPYAPTHLYGVPDDFRAFVDRAHEIGLGVILDVVYNHFGPSGCVHREYAESYFTSRYGNEWGEALNFDGTDAAPVREYVIANAGYWIEEFHLDGLRLDAVQHIHDRSSDHLVAALTRRAREAAGGRQIAIVAEHERQQTSLLRLERARGSIDAVWNDDFHHSAIVSVTGRREAYYSDYRGTPQELMSAAKHGYLFQGQRSGWQKQPRGTRADDISPAAFVAFVENHDQIANSSDGSRLHQRASSGRYRAVTALLLLLPSTPMLFQGQEFGASSPFLYFADHEGELAQAVLRGRADFVVQFPSLATKEAQARLPVPHDTATFERCKLKWEEREANVAHRRLHQDLLALRRDDLAFRQQQPGAIDGAVLGDEAFVLRYGTRDLRDERLLVVNFGPDLVEESFAEPLLAPPDGYVWQTRWSSEHPTYGGVGACPVVTTKGWRVPGHSATVLEPVMGSAFDVPQSP
ncbi:MAG: malto-oligosyltrehalose trehalohydrolase [Vicinamibacterales bacterium]